MSGRHLEFEITRTEQGVRLDRLLVAHAPELGRKRAAELFAEGRVRVDGRRVHKGELALFGQRVSAELPESEHAECVAKARALFRAAEEAVRFASGVGRGQ